VGAAVLSIFKVLVSGFAPAAFLASVSTVPKIFVMALLSGFPAAVPMVPTASAC